MVVVVVVVGGGGVLIFLDRGIPSTGKALKETVNCL